MKGVRGKSPAVQWYYKDWLADRKLQRASASTRGIWVNLLMYMLDDDGDLQGVLMELDARQISQLGGSSIEEAELFIREAGAYGFCDISVTSEGQVCIKSRRIYRDCRERVKARDRKRKQREQEACPASVTKKSTQNHILSPTPTPTPTPTVVEKDRLPAASGGHFSNLAEQYFESILQTCELIDNLPKEGKRPFNPYQWVQAQTNAKMHPGAIDETLKIILRFWPDIKSSPWAYANKTIQIKSGNYCEADARARNKVDMSAFQELAKGLIAGIGG